jgi:hypothetical protein
VLRLGLDACRRSREVKCNSSIQFVDDEFFETDIPQPISCLERLTHPL